MRTEDDLSGNTAIAAAGRRTIAVRASLCQNVIIGCAFGGFGITVLSAQNVFGIGRALATLGLALAVLTMGLSAPFVAGLMGRIGIRKTILIGVALSALGYALAATGVLMGEAGFALVLMAYGLPIGMALTMAGPFGSSMITAGWFADNPGPALGFVNMPILVALLPVEGMPFITAMGLANFYFLLAAINLSILPVVWGLADPPAHPDHKAGTAIAMRAIAVRPAFWAMVAGAGLLSAIGITGVTHLMAFGVERGVLEQQAALLVSVMGGAAVLGSLVVGMLCGLMGAARTLALIAAVTALGWAVLMATTSLPLMIAILLLVGAGGAGVFPSVNVLASRIFGAAAVTQVVGLYGMAVLPFTFLLPPLAGVLHDAAGGYGPVIWSLVGASLISMLSFVPLSLRNSTATPTSVRAQGVDA